MLQFSSLSCYLLVNNVNMSGLCVTEEGDLYGNLDGDVDPRYLVTRLVDVFFVRRVMS